MLRWLLLVCLLSRVGCSSIESQDTGNNHNLKHGEWENTTVLKYLCLQTSRQLAPDLILFFIVVVVLFFFKKAPIKLSELV